MESKYTLITPRVRAFSYAVEAGLIRQKGDDIDPCDVQAFNAFWEKMDREIIEKTYRRGYDDAASIYRKPTVIRAGSEERRAPWVFPMVISILSIIISLTALVLRIAARNGWF